jgi:hypothetical protein
MRAQMSSSADAAIGSTHTGKLHWLRLHGETVEA